MNVWTFTLLTTYSPVHRLLFLNRKNEAPNHDTGSGPGNNHGAGSRRSLPSVPTGQSSATVRPELFCQRL